KTLKKLVRKGYLVKEMGQPLSERGGRSRYFYRLTKSGAAALEEISKVHASVWSGVNGIALGENK
ncbi:PadR family transcriptional regulator, partial [candidate division KSB1 bacterium]